MGSQVTFDFMDYCSTRYGHNLEMKEKKNKNYSGRVYSILDDSSETENI